MKSTLRLRLRRALASGFMLLLAVVLASCGTQDMAGDAVARNGAAQAGKFAFGQAGHDIDGNLSCSTEDKSDERMTVHCTGTTKDSKPAEMRAALDTGAKVVTGDRAKISGAAVTGTVDGKEVFQKDCIGAGC